MGTVSFSTWFVLGFAVAITALALWTLRYQRRIFPPGSKRVGEPERKRPLPWIGNSFGGGRG